MSTKLLELSLREGFEATLFRLGEKGANFGVHPAEVPCWRDSRTRTNGAPANYFLWAAIWLNLWKRQKKPLMIKVTRWHNFQGLAWPFLLTHIYRELCHLLQSTSTLVLIGRHRSKVLPINIKMPVFGSLLRAPFLGCFSRPPKLSGALIPRKDGLLDQGNAPLALFQVQPVPVNFVH